jgi:hypothetical protein
VEAAAYVSMAGGMGCKECRGSGVLWKHVSRQNNCKECGGSDLCEHGRQEYSKGSGDSIYVSMAGYKDTI